MSNSKNQARKWWANLCFKTFSSHCLQSCQVGAGKWELMSAVFFFFFFLSYITIIRSASRLTLFLFSPFVLFPIYPIASLPSLSSPALSLLLSHWCDTHTRPLISSSLSHTHTHTLSLSLFEFRPISVNGTCSLCWLAHISFHLNSIWRENCHRRSRYQTSLNNRPVPISLDFLVEGFAEGHRSCRKT